MATARPGWAAAENHPFGNLDGAEMAPGRLNSALPHPRKSCQKALLNVLIERGAAAWRLRGRFGIWAGRFRMEPPDQFAIVLGLAVLIGCVNYVWIKLPPAIGMLLGSLAISFLIVTSDHVLHLHLLGWFRE
jgi:hypothetical protein